MSWLQDLGCVILQTSIPQGIVGNLLWGLEPTYSPTCSENIQQGKKVHVLEQRSIQSKILYQYLYKYLICQRHCNAYRKALNLQSRILFIMFSILHKLK